MKRNKCFIPSFDYTIVDFFGQCRNLFNTLNGIGIRGHMSESKSHKADSRMNAKDILAKKVKRLT